MNSKTILYVKICKFKFFQAKQIQTKHKNEDAKKILLWNITTAVSDSQFPSGKLSTSVRQLNQDRINRNEFDNVKTREKSFEKFTIQKNVQKSNEIILIEFKTIFWTD